MASTNLLTKSQTCLSLMTNTSQSTANSSATNSSALMALDAISDTMIVHLRNFTDFTTLFSLIAVPNDTTNHLQESQHRIQTQEQLSQRDCLSSYKWRSLVRQELNNSRSTEILATRLPVSARLNTPLSHHLMRVKLSERANLLQCDFSQNNRILLIWEAIPRLMYILTYKGSLRACL